VRWTVHGEANIYESDWMVLSVVAVEPPGSRRFDHHVLRFPRAASGTVIWDRAGDAVLLLWRHRFITDRWGWEIPAGLIDGDESPGEAAVREAVEESGWRPRAPELMVTYNPMPGGVDQTFHVFVADGAEHVGEPTDRTEAERVEWVPLAVVRDALTDGRIVEGMTLTALSLALATNRIG
jgi:8-oxo-dGTP pyrophosphatase MutT (NUDIX family)